MAPLFHQPSFRMGSLLLFLLPAQGSRPTPSPGRALDLVGLTQEVFQGVREETGVDLGGKVRVRWGTALELAGILTKDSQDLSRVPLGKKALAELRRRHRTIGSRLLGKYDWRKKEILIGRSNLERQARLFHLPKLLDPETLKALLTHEAIHAVDHQKYAWVEKMKGLGGAGTQLYNAVIEGHAQAVAERICKKKGWEKGFKIFSSVIGKIPDSLSGLERQMVEIRIAQTRDAYWKGRSFVLAIEKALGEKGVERLFDHPPQSFDEVLRPDWYLHPERKPRVTFDAKPAFQAFLEEMPRKEWKAREYVASLSQFGAAFSLLPAKERNWILESIQGNRNLVLGDRKNPGARLVIVQFIQFKTEADASSYLESGLRLSKIKDKKMAKGLLRITGSHYEDLRSMGVPAILASKTFVAGKTRGQVQDLFARRRNLVLELLYSNQPIPREKLLGLGRKLLEKVRFQKAEGSIHVPQPSSRPGEGK